MRVTHLPRQRGFTLIEMMLAVTIVAILLGIGVPSFQNVLRNSFTADTTNDFIAVFTLARSEATKLGVPVTVCAANPAQTSCAGAGTTDWHDGFLLFTDRLGNPGTVDAGDEILRRFPAMTHNLAMTTDGAGFVRFGPNGQRTEPAAANVRFTIRHPDCTGRNVTELTLTLSGRATMRKLACQ